MGSQVTLPMKLRNNIICFASILAFTVALCAYASTEPAPTKVVRIELTVDQLAVVQACMNSAVKIGGLSDARVILPVWDAIEAQVKSQLTDPVSK